MENRSSTENFVPGDELLQAIRNFLYTVPIARLSKGLRNLFLTCMYHEADTPSLDLEDFILDVRALFDLLDAMEPSQAKGSSFL